MSFRRIGFHARDGLKLSALDWPGPEGRTPLLCLPGLTRAAEDFASLAERHAGTRRVLALDHAGHGESARAAALSRYAVEESLRDVLDAMAALHCPRAVILGTSFGGLLTMALAVLRPSAIAGAVLNDIGPEIAPGALAEVEAVMARDPALPSLDAVAAHLRATLPPLTLDEDGWRRHAAIAFAPGKDGLWHPRWDTHIAQVLRNNGPPPVLWGPFGALAHAPLMLVRGELSTLLTAEVADRMRRERPDMAFVNVPGCGHAPTLLEPQVVPVLDRFLHAIA